MEVYEPAEDSYLLIDVLKNLKKIGWMLDLGTGSGIISLSIGERAKRIIATDINKEAIRKCLSKIKKRKFSHKCDVIVCDLLTALRPNMFDIIAFNPPYLPDDGYSIPLDVATIKDMPKGDVIIRFIRMLPKYLGNGRAFMVASTLSDLNKIKREINQLGMKCRIISSKKFFFEEIVVFEISK